MVHKKTDSELWRKIQAFDIDGGVAAFPFVKKLARENGWDLGHSEKVIEEYRRFVYLAMVAGHPVSPSDQVDQSWHMHMLYTESYWSRMTVEILPRPLHHGPSKGGSIESQKFDDWYARTLDSYRNEFGEEPPSDVWPPVGSQFSGANACQRVNCRENWIVRKAKVRQLGLLFGGVTMLGFIVVGCTKSLPLADLTDESFLPVLLGGGVLFMFIVFFVVGKAIRSGNESGGGTGCSSGGGFHSIGTSGHHSTDDSGNATHATSSEAAGAAAGDAAGGAAGDSGGGDGGGD